ENISSISAENYSVVILEFAQSANMDTVSWEMREKIDQIRSYWDDSVGNPIIMKINPDMLPVMISAVGGRGMSTGEISDLVSGRIVPELESIEGVASVSVSGLLEESVNVIIRQEKIDAINKQVFGYIEGEMADAEQKLIDGRQEILDGQEKLDEAQKELDDGYKGIEDGRREIAKNKQKISDGRAELADGLAKLDDAERELADGRVTLAEKREETAQQLADGEKQLLTAKSALEAAKLQITTNIATVQGLADFLKKTEAGKKQLDEAIAAFDAVGGIDAVISGLEALVGGVEAAITAGGGMITTVGDLNVPSVPEMVALYNGVHALNAYGLPGVSFDDSTPLATVAATLNATIETLSELTGSLATVNAAIAQIEANISAATMGMGAAAFLKMMNGQLEEINKNLGTVDSGVVELAKGTLTAAIEFAGAQTQMDIGELQISMGRTQLEAVEAQLDAAMDQIKAAEDALEDGIKQLESGQETIDENRKKLEEGLDQIKEGEEQLAEAKADALLNADMHDVITVDLVKNLLFAQNFSMPGGYVTEEGIDYLVRVGDKPDNIEGLLAMPLLNMKMEGVDIITLADVADVFMTDNSEEIYANVNGSNGILLTIQKQTGYSTGSVSDRLLDKYAELEADNKDLIIITFMDQGIYIDLVTGAIFSNMIWGAILALLFIVAFLRDIKATLVIVCSIPISLVTAVVLMYFSGITLNVISLSGLALGVGMLIDNSIVVIENIYRLRAEGHSRIEAAIEGTRSVRGAIVAATLTTVCVFAPIVFTEGITRQLFVDMGLTIGYSLGASLVVAMTVVPALASVLLRTAKVKEDAKWYAKLVNGYETLLRFALKHKWVVLVPALVLVIASGLAAYARGFTFMDEMDSPQMSISLEFPKDVLLPQVAEATDEAVEILRGLPEVTDIGATTGGGGYESLLGGAMGGGGGGAGNASTIYLLMPEDKERTNVELAAVIEDMLADIVERENIELAVSTSEMDISMLSGSGITINVKGREIDTLQAIAADVAAIVETVEGTTEVSDGMEDSSGELRIVIDRDKAIGYGLTVAQVFQQVVAKLSEATSNTAMQTEIRDYDVYVRSAADLALTRETLKDVLIDGTDSDNKKIKVPLREMADFEETVSPNSINRQDQTRYIGVTAAIAEGYNVSL
ncbi:MAG: efflux RND transporter permease subunit, partial [Lachnospiraceae bacterium]|nr:efflux RND transporter permease subunit [Lachnospiraceae bacterium]